MWRPASLPKLWRCFHETNLPKSLPFLTAAAVLILTALMSGMYCAAGQGDGIAPIPPQVSPPTLPFSHKLHTQFLKACQDCHQVSSEGWTMNYPPEEKCMSCHATVKADSPAIKKLAEYAAQKKPVPWVQIYKVPDFVYFSHRKHVQRRNSIVKIATVPCASAM